MSKQKQLITEIMNDDAKDGLYETERLVESNKTMTAVEWLIGQLQKPCSNMTEKIIEQAKQMEKEQIIYAFISGKIDIHLPLNTEISGEQFYNIAYGK